jgi:hypothetical protein
VDERSLAQAERSVRVYEDLQQASNCFFCLLGWVFLGSIGYDGEEVYEAIRYRKCGGGVRSL